MAYDFMSWYQARRPDMWSAQGIAQVQAPSVVPAVPAPSAVNALGLTEEQNGLLKGLLSGAGKDATKSLVPTLGLAGPAAPIVAAGLAIAGGIQADSANKKARKARLENKAALDEAIVADELALTDAANAAAAASGQDMADIMSRRGMLGGAAHLTGTGRVRTQARAEILSRLPGMRQQDRALYLQQQQLTEQQRAEGIGAAGKLGGYGLIAGMDFLRGLKK